MPEVNGVEQKSNLAYRRRNTVTSTNANMSIEDFYKIMSAQLKYQDPSNPADSTDMLNQMTQMAMISAIENMNTMTQTTYAASMMGKEVTVAKVEAGSNKVIGEEKGIVTGVNLTGKQMTLWVNGKEYPLSRVVQIGKSGKEKKPGNGTSNTTGTGNTGTGNTGSSGNTGSTGSTTGVPGSTNTSLNNQNPSSTSAISSTASDSSSEYMSHVPAANTDDPANATPPMTVISENPEQQENTIPTYKAEENEDKIITPVG